MYMVCRIGARQGIVYFLVCDVVAELLLQALAYALCGDGVEVAGAQDLVYDGGVGCLDLGWQGVCGQSACAWCG
jgi:hypothetical protein